MKIKEIKIGDLILERETKVLGVIVEKSNDGVVAIRWNRKIYGHNQTWESAHQISKVGNLLEVTTIPF